jgi:hypothetical protein
LLGTNLQRAIGGACRGRAGSRRRHGPRAPGRRRSPGPRAAARARWGAWRAAGSWPRASRARRPPARPTAPLRRTGGRGWNSGGARTQSLAERRADARHRLGEQPRSGGRGAMGAAAAAVSLRLARRGSWPTRPTGNAKVDPTRYQITLAARTKKAWLLLRTKFRRSHWRSCGPYMLRSPTSCPSPGGIFIYFFLQF